MQNLLLMPIIIPLATAGLMLASWRRRAFHRWLTILGMAALFGVSLVLLATVRAEGIQVVHVGGWRAPIGISFVADLLSAAMVVITAFIGLMVALYSLPIIDARRETFGYHPLFHILVMGICGAFLTGDLFNLFVWFEVMLIASFVLLSLGAEKKQLAGAIRYVTINLISSAVFLSAVGLLYGLVGTLNMADLAVRLSNDQQPALITTIAMLFIVCFGIKAAIFPLFFWLPASYHTPPIPITAIFAGLLTKVGVYAMIRVFTLIFVQDIAFTHTLIMGLSALTMLTGVLGAVAQNEFRRVLSFHIISQIGYMTLGLGLFTVAGLAGSIFYIIHHIVVKNNLFLISGIAAKLGGSYELGQLGGLYKRHWWLALFFMIPAMSLAGIPPLSGFFAKLTLIAATLEAAEYLLVGIALIVGLLTLFSMIKIWNEAFWKAPPEEIEPGRLSLGVRSMALTPIAISCIVTVFIGLGAGYVLQFSIDAANQLMNPQAYITAVLGGEP
jgi:multicomponent Na+:H+ antiporter subunit D